MPDVMSVDGRDAMIHLDAAMDEAVSLVRRFLESDDSVSVMELIFGQTEVLVESIERRVENNTLFPEIRVVSEEDLPNADGAYLADIDTILLSDALFDETGQPLTLRLVDVLLEEAGHRIDALVNEVDTVGDEGHRFAIAVRGEPVDRPVDSPLATEHGVVTINDASYDAEFAVSVADSGGYEGSSRTLQLESTDGGTLTYQYEHYTIPDRFVITYEGRTLLDTGFTGGHTTETIEVPQGNSDTIQIQTITNNSGTAWWYDVTVETCPDITPLVVTSQGTPFEYNETTQKCETNATVTLGRTDGTNPLLKAEGATAVYCRNAIDLSNTTFYAQIGGVTDSLWQGSVNINTATRQGSITETGSGTFQLAGLDTDFKDVTILRDKIAFDVLFRLPDEATGLVVDTVNIFDDALIIDQNGPHFVLGGKLNLPDVESFRLLNVVDVSAKNNSIEYRASEDALRFQSKIGLENFFKADGGSTSVEADLSGDNYVQINSDGDVDMVGSLKVSRELAAPRGWGLKEVELTINTVTDELGGSATIRTPFGTKFGEGAEVKPSIEFYTGGDGVQLDALGLEIDNMNKPIPAYPAFFFQRIGGEVDNFAPDNPKGIEFSGGIGATLGPQIGGTRLARLDLDAKIDANQITGTAKLDILTAEFEFFGYDLGTFTLINGTGESTLNWSEGFYKNTGNYNFLDGFINTGTTLKFDKDFNFSTGGNAALGIPDFIPSWAGGGTEIANANYALCFTNDDIYSNDFLAGWGQYTVSAFGFNVDLTLGLNVKFDGTVERIGAGNIPEVGSWDITGDEEYMMFTATWENEAPDAKMVVKFKLPDGEYEYWTEDEFADHNILVLDEFSSSTSRTVIAFDPNFGRWDIEMADPEGLGDIDTEAYGPTEGTVFDFVEPVEPVFETEGDEVTINFEASDADSVANISFWYDDDNTVTDGLFIGETTEQDGAGSFVWNTATVVPGDYYVYAMVNDGQNPVVIEYTDNTIHVEGRSADLSVDMSASDNEPVGGNELTYTINVENLSEDDAVNASLLVTLPDNVVPGDSFLDGNPIVPGIDGNELVFDLDDFPGNDAAALTIDVVLPDVDNPTQFAADALILADSYDPEPGNDTGFVDGLVQPEPPATIDLSVQAGNFLPVDEFQVGDAFTYSISVTNNGPDSATSVVLDEFIDNAFNVQVTGAQNLGGGNYRVNLGTINPGETEVVNVSGTALAAGTLVNSSRVNANEVELTPEDGEELREIDVALADPDPADLSITLDATEPDDLARSTVTVELTNSGPGFGTDIEVLVTLPEGGIVDTFNSLQGTFNPDTGIWAVGNMRDNLSRTLQITLDGMEATESEVTAEVINVDQDDPDSTPGNGVAEEDDFATLDVDFSSLDPMSVFGTDGDDLLVGGRGDDRLYGNGGDDLIDAAHGDDQLFGNKGNDTLSGGSGDDQLYGGDHDDVLSGGSGNDQLYGGEDNDELSGDSGNDRLFGGNGKDTLEGEDGDDTLFGGKGEDVLNGGAGQDLIWLGDGEDRLHFDQVPGDANHDTVMDFNPDQDSIVINNGVMAVFDAPGELADEHFVLGDAAQDADDYLIYDQPNGELYYDADGNDAVFAKQLLGIFQPAVNLDAASFEIVGVVFS